MLLRSKCWKKAFGESGISLSVTGGAASDPYLSTAAEERTSK